MKKILSYTLIKVITAAASAALLTVLILLWVSARTQEADLVKALQTFKTIRHAAEHYLRLSGDLSKDLWTPSPNPCNPTLRPGELSWASLGLEDPHQSDPKWYYVLYIEKSRSFSIGAISKDCSTQFLEVVHARGNTEWTCAENAGMRPIKEKNGTVSGCTYL